jgi:type VI secretion system protein ImpH
MFGVEAEVEQFVPSRLVFEVNDRTRLGGRNATLGEDALLGGSVFSVQDKFRIRITTASLAEYRRFLPTGDRSKPLADLVFLFNGEQLDWDVELALPARAAEPVRLSRSGQLGWTGWLAPREARDGEVRCDARFRPGRAAGPDDCLAQETLRRIFSEHRGAGGAPHATTSRGERHDA